MIRGGNGSHWQGCHKIHWDCGPLKVISLDHKDETTRGKLNWEKLRQVRNECAKFMTGSQKRITMAAQHKFRRTFDPVNQRIYIIVLGDWTVGFLYLRYIDDEWVPTYGVRQAARGFGYGKFLVQLSQLLVPSMKLEVQHDNITAITLYERQGFTIIKRTPKVFYMRWPR